MSATTVTELWQLAATLMGELGTSKVLDATSPTLPLEKTFNAFYDQVRLSLIKRGEFDFATQTKVLREAPTIDYRGKAHVWSNVWRYAYAPPVGMVKFLRFVTDIPEAGVFQDYLMKRLPILYAAVDTTTIVTSVYSYVLNASKIWRGSFRASFFDESQNQHTVVDKAVSSTSGNLQFYDEVEDATDLTNGFDPTYDVSIPYAFDLAIGDTAGFYDFATSAWPTAMRLEYAVGDPYVAAGTSASWSENVMTNLVDAEAVYLVDMTNVALWPEEFQLAVASEMARRAALVHSKSSKMIQGLSQAAAIDFSEAVANLTSDNGTIYSGQVSGAELARL